jgi:Restriction endonuclease S subunits
MAASKPSAEQLITENIDVWTSSIKKRGSQGRGSSKKIELYGIKKLRELILELAVRGLLVPQNPNDEPASVLLEKIASEKEQLIKDKKIKKPKKLLAITDDEKVGGLPEGWEFVRLNDLGEWGAGATPRRGNSELYGGGIPWFKSGELVGDYISVSEETVTEEALKQASLRFNKVGDVLLAMYGATIGKTSILSVEATTNQAVCACTPFTGFSNIFLLTLLKAYKPRFIAMGAGGAQPNISREKIIATVIATPPEAEQPRIVAKVNELMALCDQLEQQTETSLTAHQTLVESLLNTLLTAAQTNSFSNTASSASAQAAGTEESISKISSFDQAWNRLAQHFDVLFTTEHSIDQLKQAILQLAVMGKLVPQDPNDKPASVLIEKITAKKEKLIKDGKIKKQKPLPEIDEVEKPFELPKGWVWCTLSHLGIFSGGKTPSKSNSAYWGGDIPWVTPKDMKVDYIYDSEDHVTDLAIKDGLAKINKESILFVARSGILRRKFPVAITKIECTVNQDLKVLSLVDKSLSHYILTMMQGFESYILKNLTKIGTTVESLKFDAFSIHFFILPPEAEQHRIVAKVDELMALCDTLKESIGESQTTQLHLADAVAEQTIR